MFSAEVIGGFIVGSLALSVLGNAIYGLLTNWLGASSPALVGIALGMALVLGFSAWMLTHLLRRGRSSAIVDKKPAGKRSGLIVLVSNNMDAVRRSVAWHGEALTNCWLICSPQSAQNAQTLQQEIIALRKEAYLETVDDVYDPIKFVKKIAEINARAKEAKIAPDDLILDFTGMTSIASVGCVLACLQDNHPLQYTPGIFNPNMKVLEPLDPIEITLDYSVQTMLVQGVVADTKPQITNASH